MILDFNLSDINNELETIGTKQKFWVLGQELHKESNSYLVKLSTDNRQKVKTNPNIIPIVGEHWAEYISSKLCELLEIPHATYQICRVFDDSYYDGFKWGVITENILSDHEEIVLGNQFLFNESNDYPDPSDSTIKHYKNSKHAIETIFDNITNANIGIPCLTNTLNACDLFCGYLLLDVLIGNQDRHHENWAIIQDLKNNRRYLCPTYDHAASLGRNESDTRKDNILKEKDGFGIDNYVKNAKSGLYSIALDKQLKTLEAYQQAIIQPNVNNTTHDYWLTKLRVIDDEKLQNIFCEICDTIMSPISKSFAISMLKANKNRLLELQV